MFILSLTYTAPLSEVDAHIEPHLAWVAAASSKPLSRPTLSFSPA